MMKSVMNGYNFIENKYYKWYIELIEFRMAVKPHPNFYTETHHIIPKSMGGTNKHINLVKLTAREHFIAHLCLSRCTTGRARYKMVKAFQAMNMRSQSTHERYINSRIYEYIRNELSINASHHLKELWQDHEFRKKMLEARQWTDKRLKSHLEYLSHHSPFKEKETHEKCMKTRTKNKTNPFVTNNPMMRPECKKKKLEKTSGANHYIRNRISYFYRFSNEEVWSPIDSSLSVKQICERYNWQYHTFFNILKGQIPKNGNMSRLQIKRIFHEDQKNRKI